MSSGTLGTGVRHLRTEWGRWWRAEDLTDTHIAHRVLNDQYRMWRALQQRGRAEVQQNLSLLKQQQRQATQMQMQRMHMQRQQRARGGYGGRGYGGGMFGGMGASPVISYKMMQWAQLQMRMGQQEFQHLEVTPSMIQIGYGQVRSRRHLAAMLVLPALVAGWVGLWWVSVLAVLAVTATAALVFTAAAWAKGRNPSRRRPPVPKLLFVPPKPPAHTELAEPEPVPFPLREAGRDPRRTRESVSLALRKERVQVDEVGVPVETEWGWTVPLVLSGGTLGDLVKALPKMATPLRVGTNRLLAQSSDPNDAAAVTLRILLSDPFAQPLPPPMRPPLSCSITQPFSAGLSIDGETTPVVLAGQHVLIVSDSGGGKSTMVRTLAEYTTACTDAVAVDIDPTGRGLGPLGPCAARRALNPQDAEQLLAYLLAKAEARIAAMGDTVDNWVVTPDDPAIIAFIDEWPRLSKRGKELALALLRIGRKARISLVICTQDATADIMGDAVADAFGLRIMLPCRQADVPLVVGDSSAISKGWLPHLLVPSPGEWEIADAGRFYAITPRHRQPILRYVSPIDAATAAARAKERVAAGLPSLEPVATAGTPGADTPEIVRLLLEAFATHGDPETLTVAQLGDYLATVDPVTWKKWDGREDRNAMIGRTLKSRFKKAGCTVPTVRAELPGRPTAYRLDDVRGALS
jgi:S-DNA-T family DNA segregation ATPase FtsK/SpoIIIE